MLFYFYCIGFVLVSVGLLVIGWYTVWHTILKRYKIVQDVRREFFDKDNLREERRVEREHRRVKSKTQFIFTRSGTQYSKTLSILKNLRRQNYQQELEQHRQQQLRHQAQLQQQQQQQQQQKEYIPIATKVKVKQDKLCFGKTIVITNHIPLVHK